MFTSLLVKEWKDKAVIALFGLVMMAAFAAAFGALDVKDDLREVLAAAFLSLFFPAMGAILGAGAFESEFRDGAWAFLLSRPVRKETVWLAKLVALLSVLAGFGLIFLGLMAAVPGLGATIAGYTLPGMHELVLNMPPLVLFTSLFFFSVAFSLSILSEKLLGLVLGSIFLGSLVQAALTYFAFQAEGRGLLSKAGLYPWLDAYKLALVLSGLAFLAASLLAFRRADFSQPKRKAASLAGFAALFLIVAWGLAALWPTLRPGRPEELESRIEIVGGQAYFATTRGFYRYDIGRDSLKKVARWRSPYVETVIGGGKLLYIKWEPREEWASLCVMNLDGREKRTLLGAGPGADPIDWRPWGLLLSPDGRRAAVVTMRDEKKGRSRPEDVWLIPTDGSGKNERLRLDPDLQADMVAASWFRIIAWTAQPDSLIFMLSQREGPRSLWRFDLATGTQHRLRTSAWRTSISASPSDGLGLIASRVDDTGPIEIAFIDLESGETCELARRDAPSTHTYLNLGSASWSSSGEAISFLFQVDKRSYAPVYCFRSEGRTMIKEGEPFEYWNWGYSSLSWAEGDSRLVLAQPMERSLKILDRDLTEVGRIRFPESIRNVYGGQTFGRTMLFQAAHPDSVWRLDLDTEKWKRIW